MGPCVGCVLSLSVLSPLAVTACCGNLGSELKEGVEKSMAVSADIKKEYGVESNVSINISDGKRRISVVLASTPSGDAQEIKKGVEAIVMKHFPDADEVDIKM